MTAQVLLNDPRPLSDVVDPAEFLNRLIGRCRLERADDLKQGFFGLLDPLTGARVTVPVEDMTRYTARQLERTHVRRDLV